jgi:hypothetical protein
MQEKRTEENEHWRRAGWAKSEAGKVAEGNVSWKNSWRLKSETGEAGRREWALKKSRRG